LEKLGELQKMQLVTLEDAAVADKDQKGKAKVTQTLEKMKTGSASIFGDSLDPSESALFTLVVEATTDKMLPEMAILGGTVYPTSLSYEDEATLKQALEHEEVSKAAEASLVEDLK
jgi:uncharacterized membrane protein